MNTHTDKIPFRNGFLSVQANKYVYCEPREDSAEYFMYEVAYITHSGNFWHIKEWGKNSGGVYAWVPKSKVISLLRTQGYTLNQVNKLLPQDNR
jgi:hypothetical protein